MAETCDVVVVGLGAMGAATVYQLARRGVRVIGIDRFAPPHDHGSSHGETRITREAVGEGDIYCGFARRSHALWRELEGEVGDTLLLECGFAAIDTSGGLSLLHNRTGFVERTINAAVASGIAHEELSPSEAMHRFPAFSLPGDSRVYFEPGGGLLFPERCIRAQLKAARRLGAIIRFGEEVTGIDDGGGSVVVTSVRQRYAAGQVVLASGAWAPAMAGGAEMASMRLLRQVLHWFEVERPESYAASTFPTFIWTHGPTVADSFYGFPMVNGLTPGLKVATEQYSHAAATPRETAPNVRSAEVIAMHADHVDGRLHGVSRRALKSRVCLYTQSPDADFVIGPCALGERVRIVSACSGHGFKHSAALGELLADHLTAGAPIPEAFAPDRAGLRS